MFGMITRSQARLTRGFAAEAISVVHNVAKQQFTVDCSDKDNVEKAVLSYTASPPCITFLHTEVPKCYQGKGVGQLLAKSAFTYAKENNLSVTIKCHFLTDYYLKNIQNYSNMKVVLQTDS